MESVRCRAQCSAAHFPRWSIRNKGWMCWRRRVLFIFRMSSGWNVWSHAAFKKVDSSTSLTAPTTYLKAIELWNWRNSSEGSHFEIKTASRFQIKTTATQAVVEPCGIVRLPLTTTHVRPSLACAQTEIFSRRNVYFLILRRVSTMKRNWKGNRLNGNIPLWKRESFPHTLLRSRLIQTKNFQN